MIGRFSPVCSFCEVDVCSLKGRGEHTQPEGKKETGAGAGRACRGTRVAQSHRDRATFALARPVRDRRL
jgi:hypothetical protein